MVKDADREALCRGFVRMGGAGARLAPPAVPERLIAVSMLRPERLAALARGGPDPRYLAMDNCPNQAVMGGTQLSMNSLAREIVESGGVAMPLPFSRAYHTPLFADWASTFAAHYDELSLGSGRVPVFSCCTATALPDEPERCRRAMAAQWTAPVRFSATIEALYESSGVRTFVEVGPESRLTAFVEDILRGRPHVAASMSSSQRGEVEQLCHLLGELFVAGLPIEPGRLAQLFDAVARPVYDVRAFGAQVHGGLIAEARATLARADAAIRAVTRDAAAARPQADRDGWPLIGTVNRATATRLNAARFFARHTDPFVDDHALGRRDSGWPGSPLPVLPFTLCLEVVSEAACRLTGRPAREILDARASRWLALDAGALTVDIEAEHDRGQVRVRLADAGAALSGAAFEATIPAPSASPEGISVRPDPDATAPQPVERLVVLRSVRVSRSWLSRDLQRDVGRTARDRSRVVHDRQSRTAAVVAAPGSGDARLRGPAGGVLASRAATAGSDLWHLSVRHAAGNHRARPREGRHDRPLSRRDPFDRLTTHASFVFETADGLTIAAVEGLAQRLIEFPPWLAQCIFGRGGRGVPPPDRPVPVSASIADRELLTASWGIWERALAHLCLAPDDFSTWRRKVRLSDDERLPWLLSHMAHQQGDRETIANGEPC